MHWIMHWIMIILDHGHGWIMLMLWFTDYC